MRKKKKTEYKREREVMKVREKEHETISLEKARSKEKNLINESIKLYLVRKFENVYNLSD